MRYKDNYMPNAICTKRCLLEAEVKVVCLVHIFRNQNVPLSSPSDCLKVFYLIKFRAEAGTEKGLHDRGMTACLCFAICLTASFMEEMSSKYFNSHQLGTWR